MYVKDIWYKSTGKIASKMYTIFLKLATNKNKRAGSGKEKQMEGSGSKIYGQGLQKCRM
jgi:hypothetical protein